MKKFIILIIILTTGIASQGACKLEKIITGSACSINQKIKKQDNLKNKIDNTMKKENKNKRTTRFLRLRP